MASAGSIARSLACTDGAIPNLGQDVRTARRLVGGCELQKMIYPGRLSKTSALVNCLTKSQTKRDQGLRRRLVSNGDSDKDRVGKTARQRGEEV